MSEFSISQKTIILLDRNKHIETLKTKIKISCFNVQISKSKLKYYRISLINAKLHIATYIFAQMIKVTKHFAFKSLLSIYIPN